VKPSLIQSTRHSASASRTAFAVLLATKASRWTSASVRRMSAVARSARLSARTRARTSAQVRPAITALTARPPAITTQLSRTRLPASVAAPLPARTMRPYSACTRNHTSAVKPAPATRTIPGKYRLRRRCVWLSLSGING